MGFVKFSFKFYLFDLYLIQEFEVGEPKSIQIFVKTSFYVWP